MAESSGAVAGYEDPVSGPRDWDKAVSVAYLRMIGLSQAAAARGAGVGERTILRWEKCSWWEDARREAQNRWMNDLVAEARGSVFRAIKAGDADLALKILERVDPKLLPPSYKVDLSGEVVTHSETHIYLPSNERDADGAERGGNGRRSGEIVQLPASSQENGNGKPRDQGEET